MSSTALDIALRENERLTQENAELRRSRPRPLTLRLDDVRDGEVLSEERLAEYLRAQRHGTLQFRAGEQREVRVLDRVGRLCTYFLGDASLTWDAFTGRHRRVAGYSTFGRKV